MKNYITRDKSGVIYLWINANKDKFVKTDADLWIVEKGCEDCVSINRAMFPEVKWEDKEPTEVEIKIKK